VIILLYNLQQLLRLAKRSCQVLTASRVQLLPSRKAQPDGVVGKQSRWSRHFDSWWAVGACHISERVLYIRNDMHLPRGIHLSCQPSSKRLVATLELPS
jgi:hypothetical protein